MVFSVYWSKCSKVPAGDAPHGTEVLPAGHLVAGEPAGTPLLRSDRRGLLPVIPVVAHVLMLQWKSLSSALGRLLGIS